jgi:AraC-like DNA-binding protein/transcriptional regulator with XRE-family HTH domain
MAVLPAPMHRANAEQRDQLPGVRGNRRHSDSQSHRRFGIVAAEPAEQAGAGRDIHALDGFAWQRPRRRLRDGALSRQALSALLRRARSGLTADELARRTGVGLEWYLALESGNHTGVSAMGLAQVARALGLAGEDRSRVFALAGLEEPAAITVREEPIGPDLKAVLRTMTDLPAYITGIRGDVLAWNDLSSVVYGCGAPPGRRNLLLFTFAQPAIRRFVANWEDQARTAVDAVRETTAGRESDPWIGGLLSELGETSPDFATFWHRSSGRPGIPALKRFVRPPTGPLTFWCTALSPAGGSGLRLWVYRPADDDTRNRLGAIAASRRRNREAVRQRAWAVQRARAYLDEQYDRDVPLDELAAFAGTSRFALLRWFSTEVGLPPHSYQLQVRVERARRLLAQGLPGAEVAAAVGFGDQSHLIRQFRRHEGVTPGEFARQREDQR